MKQTSDLMKKTFTDNVIRRLEEIGKKREIKLIVKQVDLTKMYKRAQGFVRENKQCFDGIELYKRVNTKVLEDTSCLLDKDVISDTDEQFISKIESVEKCRQVRTSEKLVCVSDGISMLKKGIEMGIIKISKSFIDENNIDIKLFGYNEKNEAFYCCNGINGYFEVV